MIEKVYISVDIEGIWGVANKQSTIHNDEGYESARENMINETNIVIENLIKNGVKEILVNDGHGKMNNLIANKLNPKAKMIVSNNLFKECGMMEGITSEFDACMFIGYHSGIGTKNAVLNHTISSKYVSKIKLNGIEANETLLNAHLAWYYGVPVVLVSGDNIYIEQVNNDFNNEIISVETKKSISRENIINISYEELLKRYETNIKEAIENPKIFLDKKEKYEIEITFYREQIAEFVARIPTVLKKDNCTVIIKDTNYLNLYKLCRFCILVAQLIN